MLTVLRHLLAILLLPFTVVVVIPTWLLHSYSSSSNRWPLGWGPGALIFLSGFALFAWCMSLFVRVGQGTLAPWDPTRNLVSVGPYCYVRNPMISGVLIMLLGEALFFGSPAIALWAAIFFATNHTYFLLLEEPGLERRFGESYREYQQNVPRWVPRLKPWRGG
ncbi:MAG TPA: isoprenylcysteine carboxylmethyltransferase family protein [Anaerolineales bacterium]